MSDRSTASNYLACRPFPCGLDLFSSDLTDSKVSYSESTILFISISVDIISAAICLHCLQSFLFLSVIMERGNLV